MLYPLSLVACEERFGSWMVEYGYANYVTPRKLLQHARVGADGQIEMAGRKFGTLAVLFEPLPPPELMDFLERFAGNGGKLIWSGPPPRFDLSAQPVLGRWQKLFGVKTLQFGVEGQVADGRTIQFSGMLGKVPAQTVLTEFLVDLTYPIEPDAGAEVVARVGQRTVGIHRRLAGNGSATFLGFRPRDDQSASLGAEVRTWFEILLALGAYPGSGPDPAGNDNPSVVSRTTAYVACRFPNGTTSLAAHYRTHEESWPGGFHRDAQQDQEILTRNPLPPATLSLRGLQVNGRHVSFQGELTMAFRLDGAGSLVAFAGHNCRSITIDGREYVFASQPVALAAWAPVLPQRQVPGGAVMEVWVHGEAAMTLPLPAGVKGGQLYFAGGRPGSFGEKVACDCPGGVLQFNALNAWPQKHLFFVAG
jgi:hypothetical protein